MTLSPSRALFALALVLGLAGCAPADGSLPSAVADPVSAEVTLTAPDGVALYADLHRGGGERPIVLLFHQAGASARAEYATHVPRLLGLGYDVLALDSRAGGALFGGRNRTMIGTGGREYSYCEAEQDLEAALDHALTLEGVRGRPILWGSSYSAALVLRLAARRGTDVSGVLAFSPASGAPMEGCRSEAALDDLRVPLLTLRPDREAEIPFIAEQIETFREAGYRTYVASPGVHGSSMLDSSRTGGDVEPAWAAVEAFLAGLVEPR